MRYQAKVRTDVENTATIPVPQGFKVMVALPEIASKTEGGVELPDQYLKLEATATICGCVVAMGPDCYADKAKFPTGAWCKVGDWVLFRSYSGTRFKVEEQEFRLLSDDMVEAVVRDPTKIRRAF